MEVGVMLDKDITLECGSAASHVEASHYPEIHQPARPESVAHFSQNVPDDCEQTRKVI